MSPQSFHSHRTRLTTSPCHVTNDEGRPLYKKRRSIGSCCQTPQDLQGHELSTFSLFVITTDAHARCTPQHGASGKLHDFIQTPLCARRRVPGGQKRRERVSVHTDRNVFLRSLPLWYNAWLLPLQKEGEEEDQCLHAPGTRGRAARVGRAAQEAQSHFSRRGYGTALRAIVSSFLREPRQPLWTPAPRGAAAISAGVRVLHGTEQHQFPVLLRGHALRHRGRGVGQRRHGGTGGEREGSRQQRRRLGLRSLQRLGVFTHITRSL